MIEDEEIPIEIDKGFKNKTVPTAKEIKAENKKTRAFRSCRCIL